MVLTVTASTSGVATADYVQHNAIFEKVHMASVPQESQLKSGSQRLPRKS
jgi:hypothetical protein